MASAMDKLALNSLSNLRKNLLDTTRRNPLLNYRENKRTIKIIGEKPNIIFDYLVNDRKRLTFLPIEEEKEENVTEVTLNVQLEIKDELPAQETNTKPEHIDSFLQTPHLEESLGARCRVVKAGARSAEIETGESILYLAMFFLEWYEVNHSDILNRAPLILIPVEITEIKPKKKAG
jgi:hypothetical protein